jgi:hypothetical protein
MNKNWQGLVKILEIQHIRDGKVIWQDQNILNTLHEQGEYFLLQCVFNNSGSLPPANLYFGLDARVLISTTNTISSIYLEPTSNGYFRQPVSTVNGFTLDYTNGAYRAISQIVTFTATGGGWGPVSTLFLATTSDNSGLLIASNLLSDTVTTQSGDTLTMRMSLSLQDSA